MRRIGEIIDELDLHGKNEELVKELVLLSTKHGILTPYTSFLADETSRPTLARDTEEFKSNSLGADRRLSELEQAEGRAGVAQRASKQMFLKGSSLAPPAEGLSVAKPSAAGSASYFDSKSGEQIVTSTIRTAGNQTAYKRGKRVVTPDTADLDVEKDKANIVTIQRYSKEYFELVAKNTVDDNQIISQQLEDEELLVNFRGQAYLIQ